MARIGVRQDTNKLFFDFNYRGTRCREQTTLDDTPANRKRADSVLRRLNVDIERGTFDYAAYFPGSKRVAKFRAIEERAARLGQDRFGNEPATPTLAAFADVWFEENEVRWRRTTRALMRMVIEKQLVPEFGKRSLLEISRADVLAFRAEFAKRRGRTKGSTISPKSVNDTMGVLKAIMDEAAARYGFPSPTDRIKRLKVPRSEVQPFTLDEALRVVANVREDYRDYLQVRMFSGLRTGEANGLRWKHVDFANRQLLVRETFTHGEVDDVKTDGSWREVEMSKPIIDVLKARFGDGKPMDEYVFPNAKGEPMDNHNFVKRVWNPLLRFLGLDARRPYQMRHTAATLWLAAGENPTWIARQLGHSSLEMLFRTYARWVKDMTRRDGSAFDRMLREHEVKENEDAE